MPVSGRTFTGPRLKGTIIPPGGDWIVQRPDGSRILDVRLLLQTDDGQKLYVSWWDCDDNSWWGIKRADLAGFQNGGGEIHVAEQCRRDRCLPPRFRQDRLPHLPNSLTFGFRNFHFRRL